LVFIIIYGYVINLDADGIIIIFNLFNILY